jgi:hypothetical protein
VDFNWMPGEGMVGLNVRKTVEELARRGVELSEGMRLNVFDADEDLSGIRDDLIVTGHVGRWQGIWVLIFDQPLRHQSELED